MTHVANSFFHYTNDINYLISILENDFYPRYCYENYAQLLPNYSGTNISTEMAVPMVCFCDIPLDLVSEHAGEYGTYAIGLTKEWGLKNLNPIFYLKFDSIVSKDLNFIQKLILDNKLPFEELKNRFIILQDFFAFIKPYSGISNKTKKEKVFYREREWRWIPKITQEDENKGIILRLLKEDEGRQQDANEKLKDSYKLKFNINDITYIVVPDNKTKKGIVNKIYEIKSTKYAQSDILYLISKTISLQEIKENF
jgi:hypothetical protein